MCVYAAMFLCVYPYSMIWCVPMQLCAYGLVSMRRCRCVYVSMCLCVLGCVPMCLCAYVSVWQGVYFRTTTVEYCQWGAHPHRL